jgi:serine protease Do
MSTRRKLGIWTSSMLAVAVVLGGSVWAKSSLSTGKVEAPIFAAPAKTAAMAAPLPSSFAPVIKEALPQVVNISSSRVVKHDEGDVNSLFDDPFFRQFFGDQQSGPRSRRPQNQPQTQKEQSLGSGVIFGTNGYIITNNHVVDGASDVKVFLRDKREFTAKVIGKDPKTDIAVLKVDADHLPAIPLGDSSKVEVGDLAFAIGDPFGVGQTVTMGIVSATGRANLGIEDYEDFIQTDAAINPGNSGGALIDSKGELIGINTAILSHSGGNQGVGFAIPVNLAKQVMDQIVAHGHVIRGFLGATIQNVTPTMQKALGLESADGVLIGDVTPKGPAAKAGLKPGDVITKLNGESVTDSAALRLRISETAPGTSVALSGRRGNGPFDLNVKLGELPANQEQAKEEGSSPETLRGLQVEPLTPAIQQQLHLSGELHGVVVSQVDPSSAAASAGILEGDVIQEVNRKPVTSVSEFTQAMHSAKGQPVLLRVVRDGRGFYAAIDPS